MTRSYLAIFWAILSVALLDAGAPCAQAGYDEGRNKVRSVFDGEGSWDELRMPGERSESWGGHTFDVWYSKDGDSALQDPSIISHEGMREGRWLDSALGEPHPDSVVPNPHDPEERWHGLKFSNYEADLADLSEHKDVSLSRFDPGWYKGTVFYWERGEPSDGYVRKVDETGEDIPWKAGLAHWKTDLLEEKERPVASAE